MEDLLDRLTEGCPWNKGLEAVWQGDCAPPAKEEIPSAITDNGGDAELSESDLELAEVIQEKLRLGESATHTHTHTHIDTLTHLPNSQTTD